MSSVSGIRIAFIGAVFFSPFFFPYPFTLVLSFAASLFVPFVGILIGILTDVLYFVPHVDHIPLASLLGALVSVVAFFVRRFLKARIMGQ